MRKYLVITIDVEPDCSPNWTYSDPLQFRGVSEGIARRLQPLFNRYHIAPTYLINNVVLEDAASCEVLATLSGRFELGTHLHPEFIEPQKTVRHYAGRKGVANCCFYPPHIERGKIGRITELFFQCFGYAPKSFRAGRFSAGDNTIESLAAAGYLVDTSVTPHVCWNDATREEPVDFRHAREQPYFMQPSSILQEGPGSVLQVPVSISLQKTRPWQEMKRTYFGLRRPMLTERPMWLRPVFSTYADFLSIVDEYTNRYASNDFIVFNLMFHNVEVMPGLSPYTRTERDCKKYLGQLDKFFAFCNASHIESVTLSELYDIYGKR